MILFYYLCRSSVMKISAGIQKKPWQQM